MVSSSVPTRPVTATVATILMGAVHIAAIVMMLVREAIQERVREMHRLPAIPPAVTMAVPVATLVTSRNSITPLTAKKSMIDQPRRTVLATAVTALPHTQMMDLHDLVLLLTAARKTLSRIRTLQGQQLAMLVVVMPIEEILVVLPTRTPIKGLLLNSSTAKLASSSWPLLEVLSFSLLLLRWHSACAFGVPRAVALCWQSSKVPLWTRTSKKASQFSQWSKSSQENR